MKTLTLCLILVGLTWADDWKPSQTENAVVQIAVAFPSPTGPTAVNNFGTAFFVTADGTMVTAGHVYLKAMDAMVDNRAGVLVARRFSRTSKGVWNAMPIELVAQDFSHDLAILRPRSPLGGMWKENGTIFPLAIDGDRPEEGTDVCMRGYFGSDDFPVFLRGSIAGFASLGPLGVQELLITMPVVPGQSGSPIISSDRGRVIGVLTAIVPVALPFNPQPAHSGLARAVEVEHVKRLLDSLVK